jgi:hypothetical protein
MRVFRAHEASRQPQHRRLASQTDVSADEVGLHGAPRRIRPSNDWTARPADLDADSLAGCELDIDRIR